MQWWQVSLSRHDNNDIPGIFAYMSIENRTRKLPSFLHLVRARVLSMFPKYQVSSSTMDDSSSVSSDSMSYMCRSDDGCDMGALSFCIVRYVVVLCYAN